MPADVDLTWHVVEAAEEKLLQHVCASHYAHASASSQGGESNVFGPIHEAGGTNTSTSSRATLLDCRRGCYVARSSSQGGESSGNCSRSEARDLPFSSRVDEFVRLLHKEPPLPFDRPLWRMHVMQCRREGRVGRERREGGEGREELEEIEGREEREGRKVHGQGVRTEAPGQREGEGGRGEKTGRGRREQGGREGGKEHDQRHGEEREGQRQSEEREGMVRHGHGEEREGKGKGQVEEERRETSCGRMECSDGSVCGAGGGDGEIGEVDANYGGSGSREGKQSTVDSGRGGGVAGECWTQGADKRNAEVLKSTVAILRCVAFPVTPAGS